MATPRGRTYRGQVLRIPYGAVEGNRLVGAGRIGSPSTGRPVTPRWWPPSPTRESGTGRPRRASGGSRAGRSATRGRNRRARQDRRVEGGHLVRSADRQPPVPDPETDEHLERFADRGRVRDAPGPRDLLHLVDADRDVVEPGDLVEAPVHPARSPARTRRRPAMPPRAWRGSRVAYPVAGEHPGGHAVRAAGRRPAAWLEATG